MPASLVTTMASAAVSTHGAQPRLAGRHRRALSRSDLAGNTAARRRSNSCTRTRGPWGMISAAPPVAATRSAFLGQPVHWPEHPPADLSSEQGDADRAQAADRQRGERAHRLA